jgi:hypothetical protein
VIERILQLVCEQLDAIKSCKTIFLVDDFSQSEYLQMRIKQEFCQRNINIIVPANPSLAIVGGGELLLNSLLFISKLYLYNCTIWIGFRQAYLRSR